ncbi:MULTISPECIES: hypothetical protein [unclassified Streptomyces]|uniref:hypothetical protein n=1 Tax=unclassified Streptomyces TaxID=2593676 RepID=UPI0035D60D1A
MSDDRKNYMPSHPLEPGARYGILSIREYTPANSGRHIIHTGGERASYLQLPFKNV